MNDRTKPCIVSGCKYKQRTSERCETHYKLALESGDLERPNRAPRGSFTHGSVHGGQKGCPCSPCRTARRKSLRASLDRGKEAVANGTYSGPHGAHCLKLGCTCEKAKAARAEENRKARVRKAARKTSRTGEVFFTNFKAADKKITVIHYPPRGEGMWTCDCCGMVFPHRPLLQAA